MKKFMLVPQTQIPSPLIQRLSDLDREMKTVLDLGDLSDYEKARAYSSTLEKYLQVKTQLSQPLTVPLIEQRDDLKHTDEKTRTAIDFTLFPKPYRSRAMNLMKHIENKSNLRWDDHGRILDKGVAVPDSHIVDLVGDIIRAKSTKAASIASPKGMDIFVREIKESNTPRAFIGNKELLDPIIAPLGVQPQEALVRSRVSPRGRGIRKPQTGSGKIIRWESS